VKDRTKILFVPPLQKDWSDSLTALPLLRRHAQTIISPNKKMPINEENKTLLIIFTSSKYTL
jgi:hypothetical protein